MRRKSFIVRYLISMAILQSLQSLYRSLLLHKEFNYAFIVLLCLALALTYGTIISIRRMHDLNKSAWIVFIFFTAQFLVRYQDWNLASIVVNVVTTLILVSIKGTTGPNKYGVDPLDSNYQDPTASKYIRALETSKLLDKIFGFMTRINRVTFAKYYCLNILLNTVVTTASQRQLISTEWNFLLSICVVVMHLSIVARRCHDIGYKWPITIITMLLSAISFITIVVSLFLAFKPGQLEENPFGKPPE